jgi:hypothetical protein
MLRFAFQAVIYETVSFVPITVPEKLDLRLIKDQLKINLYGLRVNLGR